MIIKVKHEGSNLCLESPGENGGNAGMKVCHGLGALQVKAIFFYLAYEMNKIQLMISYS